MGFGLDIIYGSAAVLASPFWGIRMLRTGKWRTDWRGRFGQGSALPSRPGASQRLLIHGVSVGEINAVRLLVAKLREARPLLEIVISATTDTGFARARELFAAQHTVVRFPFDLSWAVKRFLDRIQPDAVALVELEVWPNFTQICTRRSIPVCVVNGRLSPRSFRGYRRFRPLVRPMFARLSAVGAQTQDYAGRFAELGTAADRVSVCDTMKWDTAQVVDAATFPGASELAAALGIDRTGRRPLIVAGSTGPGEDKLLIDTCPPDAQLLLAPRKPEWVSDVVKLAPDIVRRSACPDGTARAASGQRLFLLDTMGELRKAYALADVCIVGRSFLGLYGSDMMEPVALGKPTIVGPYHSDFKETVEALCGSDGLIVTDQPGAVAAQLLADPARARQLAESGRRVILSRQGSTDRHVAMLLAVLDRQNPALKGQA